MAVGIIWRWLYDERVGLFNYVLRSLGIIDEPIVMLQTDFAVYLGIVYAYLPFMVLPIYAVLATAYLLGSIPTSYIEVHRVTGRDLRTIGNGNPGAMNVWDTVGLKPAMAVAMGDLAKGMAAVGFAYWLGLGDASAILDCVRACDPDVFVATKMGRRVEQRPENYNSANFRAWTDRCSGSSSRLPAANVPTW